MDEILNNKLRFVLKRGKGGKPRELVLQELVEVTYYEKNPEERWEDVPTVYEEDC